MKTDEFDVKYKKFKNAIDDIYEKATKGILECNETDEIFAMSEEYLNSKEKGFPYSEWSMVISIITISVSVIISIIGQYVFLQYHCF